MKKASLIFAGGFFIFFQFGCLNKQNNSYYKISGEAQGTTYQITYRDSAKRNLKPAIDSLLQKFDLSLSTYIQNSIITNFNTSEHGVYIDELFFEMLQLSNQVYQEGGGTFDPSINPLLTYWGFNKEGFLQIDKIDSNQIKNALQFKGYPLLKLKTETDTIDILKLSQTYTESKNWFLQKPFPQFELNFNAIAQGFSVDLIGRFLEQNNIKHYLIELGGEMLIKGKNMENKPWKLGIDKPVTTNANERPLQAILFLENGGLATSGNYRKYYEKNGKIYAHTINPKTGFPAEHNLLSATVLAPNAALADGFGTVCMVLGLEKSIALLETSNNLDGLLIYATDSSKFEVYISPGLKGKLQDIKTP